MKEKENKVTTTFEPPFTIVTYEKDGKQKHFIAVGKIRMQEEYDTYEECEQQIKGINWQLVTMLIEAYTIYSKNQKGE